MIPASVGANWRSCREIFLGREGLGGVHGNELKYHLVSWDKVCCPLVGRGLDIRNMSFNEVLW